MAAHRTRAKASASPSSNGSSLNVVFVHPDLGIGGAERLVVDAAVALQSKGHSVRFLTAHHDPSHCFPETRDGTLEICVVGDWLPRSLGGRLHALFAYLRMIVCAVWLIGWSGWQYDVVFCDQVSACIPVLKWSGKPVIFYCHFPDMLLTQRASWLKRLYRAPIDWLEEWTTGKADCILVNSKFTDGIFEDTFHSLKGARRQVLYPSLHCSTFDRFQPADGRHAQLPTSADYVFLSVNRYERKKQVELAVAAFATLQHLLPCELTLHHGRKNAKIHLVIAGGYDERVPENREYHQDLVDLVEQLGLSGHVTFLRSIDNSEKLQLLHDCTALLYTPSGEHFGIVPLEAMYMRRPVVAVASGGPLETVRHGETGFLCDGTDETLQENFAEAMKKLVETEGLRDKMGTAAREHVVSNFSFNAFTTLLDNIVRKVATG
ncbi:alpha-1,3/1,6-mannosyltransferase ALG2-like [Paramacrobiotus metropolitanus]|uniref:alpha-1,3/1,6-mannosyltransferase ALG2-like n=1 Tax=Paramacrobiotus metropolitanus TaxID=2943436 RepID=UPI002445D433|nr:alpha-1,3/1,6-mannosyltransferase ALG2-like [Paramacrobiotus metropolitanus]